MNNEKLNSLAATYAETRNANAITDLYHLTLPEFKRRWTKPGLDPHDGEEAFHMAFDELTKSWRVEQGDFLHMMNIRYKSRSTDRRRRSTKRNDNEYSVESSVRFSWDDGVTGKGEIEVAALIPDDRQNTEDTVIKKMIENGLQSVINHLLCSAKSDAATTGIVAVLRVTEYESLRQVGNIVGLHPQIVDRKLRALFRNYDESRFGDIRDYLAG